MDFADGFSGGETHFDGADDFLRIARGDAGGCFGIQTREQAMKMLGPVLCGFRAQSLAQFLGT